MLKCPHILNRDAEMFKIYEGIKKKKILIIFGEEDQAKNFSLLTLCVCVDAFKIILPKQNQNTVYFVVYKMNPKFHLTG